MKDNGEIPEFKDEYVAAFMYLLLFKNGGVQEISIEHLETFPKDKTPIYAYDSANKSWVFMTPAYQKRLKEKKNKRRKIVTPKLILPN